LAITRFHADHLPESQRVPAKYDPYLFVSDYLLAENRHNIEKVGPTRYPVGAKFIAQEHFHAIFAALSSLTDVIEYLHLTAVGQLETLLPSASVSTQQSAATLLARSSTLCTRAVKDPDTVVSGIPYHHQPRYRKTSELGQLMNVYPRYCNCVFQLGITGSMPHSALVVYVGSLSSWRPLGLIFDAGPPIPNETFIAPRGD
jgi:hypothetical protein